MSALISSTSPGVSTTTGAPAARIIPRSASSRSAPAEVRVAVGTGARRVAGVVRVQQVDAADDREHALDGVGKLLAGGVGVAGVEAEAELDVGLRRGHRLPQPGEGIEAARHGVVAAGGVLEVDRDLRLEHLEGARPSGRRPPRSPSSAWPACTITAAASTSAAASQVCWRILRDP